MLRVCIKLLRDTGKAACVVECMINRMGGAQARTGSLQPISTETNGVGKSCCQ
ncbi:hypothetical protein CLV24_105230 [Pontibacter ummariensis]|uniref:Uncharacterized protein n=1 Tax=Pontibacter ummariensis TaxID=1610492 RepID=A0A239DL64_9BACT|nr:hypothetical protein CLV24_105230 [Pontibacter ummariensis]SNS33385.1 hypothetical protein SAMN06296052_10522 [Pontibacter ummariensis]